MSINLWYSNRNSFEEIKNYYIQEIKNECKKNVKVILLRNKTDLEKEREIPSEEAALLASKNNYIFNESSCLQNKKVADATETLIENYHGDVLLNNNINEQEKFIIINKRLSNQSPKNNNSCY